MKTLQQLLKQENIPMGVSWLVSGIDEYKGKQELYSKQSPEKLKKLREHAIIESSVSSNRMEGVQIKNARVRSVVFGHSTLRDRDEEEIRGYQKALRWIHESHQKIPLNIKTILELHRLSKGRVWDSGMFKDKQVDIIEKRPDGREFIRFHPPGPEESLEYLEQTVVIWQEGIKGKTIPPLLLLAAFNLDFLAIHPFRDGNGRVSRLLLLLQLYHLGYHVGKYISIEKIIEDNKERYYETLLISSQKWQIGGNDFWPYTNYLLYILKESYTQLDARLSGLPSGKGDKSGMIVEFIERSPGLFSVVDIKYHNPGVSLDLIRKVLKDMQKEGKVHCTGRGRNAQWEKV